MKNSTELKTYFTNNMGIPEKISDKLIQKFQAANPEIQQGLQHYIETGKIVDEPKISGFSPKTLHERGETVTSALLSIDWLMKEPEKALMTIRRGRDAKFKK
ncbi:MAG: hypothetical protein HQK77_21840 [Desulfobacterales bacterium]|nr:hypothetical protein [Desulfobacterales bacterium]